MPLWRATPVLLTGATGFIGSHLATRLAALGAQVHAVSRRPPAPHDGWIWHAADLSDPAATTTLVAGIRPHSIFHLASAVTGARDLGLVQATMAGNLIGAVNLLTAVATEAPETRLVLAGSVEEPTDGTAPSPYAVAKWAATGYARMFHQLWGVATTVLRIAMVYGPGQPDVRKLVPYVTRTLLRGEDPELASGTRLVDWVYVDDVVDAFLLAAQTDRAAGRVLDIGSGTQLSIRDTVELLATLVGGSARPRFGAIPDRPLDAAQVSDPTAAGEVLGWRPTTPLRDGLLRTIAWYSAAGNDR
jgi:nucleoside-diphosphate-sugar epimerase